MTVYGLKIHELKEADDIIKALIADREFHVKTPTLASASGSSPKRPRNETETQEELNVTFRADEGEPPKEMFVTLRSGILKFKFPNTAAQSYFSQGELLELREFNNPTFSGFLVGLDANG